MRKNELGRHIWTCLSDSLHIGICHTKSVESVEVAVGVGCGSRTRDDNARLVSYLRDTHGPLDSHTPNGPSTPDPIIPMGYPTLVSQPIEKIYKFVHDSEIAL